MGRSRSRYRRWTRDSNRRAWARRPPASRRRSRLTAASSAIPRSSRRRRPTWSRRSASALPTTRRSSPTSERSLANWPHSLRALAAPNFRRYYIGQAISMVGTWIQSVAVMWLAYRLSGSTWFTGLIGFLTSAPHLFLAPFAGVLGDRVSRRKMLITVLSLLAVQSTILAALSGLHIITMPQLAALALFAGVCNAFETPTRQSIF